MTTISLLSLPLEVRRIIILEVVLEGRLEAPILSRETVQQRVPLRNCFDPGYPTETSIYINKNKEYIHGNGLLQTNRRLRQDTLDLMNDTVRAGKVDIPYVLDLMVVKDVGLLPTWMSYPYQPTSIRQLKINMRIFRPDWDIVPKSWALAALYELPPYQNGPVDDDWHMLVILLFYAMGRLSSCAKDTIVAKIWTERQARPIDEEHNGSSVEKQRAEGVEAYVRADAPYAVDDMLIHVENQEYYAAGRPILPFVGEDIESIPYKRDGYYSFGHLLFDDERYRASGAVPEPWIGSHHLASWKLDNVIKALFHQLKMKLHLNSPRGENGIMAMYLDAAARNIRAVKMLYGASTELAIGGVGAKSWESGLCNFFGRNAVDEVLALDKMKRRGANGHMPFYARFIKRRLELGWWDSAAYEEHWDTSHADGQLT